MDTLPSPEQLVVGTKQTIRLLLEGKIEKIFLAKDVNEDIKEKIEFEAKDNEVLIVYVESKSDLGKACGIERDAACAAMLKNII